MVWYLFWLFFGKKWCQTGQSVKSSSVLCVYWWPAGSSVKIQCWLLHWKKLCWFPGICRWC